MGLEGCKRSECYEVSAEVLLDQGGAGIGLLRGGVGYGGEEGGSAIDGAGEGKGGVKRKRGLFYRSAQR